jgi:lipopolysaccharide/colanic/teichoic acid biosynthesis glycosyltransferase
MRRTHRYPLLKRGLDIIASVVFLVLAAPAMLVAGLLIWAAMGRPVLFRQRRPGRLCRPFTLLKFRTMADTQDAGGRPLGDCDRLTPVGRFLRRLSLDELPQLWNVLRGEMSLVGPRPLLMEYLPCYTERERTRHLVRPGITGLAQVSGRNRLGWDERLELDARYAESQSLGLDLHILFRTFWRVARSQDIVLGGLPDLTDERRGRTGVSVEAAEEV